MTRRVFVVLRNMASLNYVLKDLPQAAYYLEEMIRADPNDSYAYVALGQVLVEQKIRRSGACVSISIARGQG